MSNPARLDAHQHFWVPSRGDYPWMGDSGPLVRPFLPAELRARSEGCGIAGTVAVQAAPTIAETRWLLELAGQPEAAIVAVVGWVDLEAPDVARQLDEVAHPKLVGIRPMIQDIPDDDWVLRPQVIDGLRALEQRRLAFDLLGYTRHLPAAIRALDRVPDLTVVIDHLMKPDYGDLAPGWTAGMSELAQRPRCFVKISGMATEVQAPPRAALFRRHIEYALDAFGPERCLIGTDWPVSTLALSYPDMVALLDELVEDLGEQERDAVWRTSACRAYGVELPHA